MYIVIFILRAFVAFASGVSAIACFGTRDWYPAIGFVFGFFVSAWPLLPIISGKARIRKQRRDHGHLTGARIFAIIRHFTGYCCIFFGSALMSLTYKDSDPGSGFLMLIMGLIISVPLDRVFFAPPPATGKFSRKWIYFLRNAGLWVYSMSVNGETKWPMNVRLTLFAAGLGLLSAHPAYLMLTGKKISFAPPPEPEPMPVTGASEPQFQQLAVKPLPMQPTSRPAPGASEPQSEGLALTPLPIQSASEPRRIAEPTGPHLPPPLYNSLLRPPLSAPVSRLKRPSYRDATSLEWRYLFSKTTGETLFNQLVRDFEEDWLLAKDIRHRLTVHRNPPEFKKETVADLKQYLKKIRGRNRMQHTDKTQYDRAFVMDVVKEIWMGDRRVRSLYEATRQYCAMNKATNFDFIALHIAEYRAMNNLVKRLNHSIEKDNAAIIPPTPRKTSGTRDKKAVLASAVSPGAPASPAPPAPSLSKEALAHLNDENYFTIVDYIILLGKNLENYKDLNDKFNEERYRDYFLPFLNAVSPHYSAKGEAFNRKGKTDILVFDKKGNNVFIAECKLWRGEAYLLSGLDQLLNNYVNWRDEKAALIVFNREVQQFSYVITTATEALSRHPLCQKTLKQRTEASWSYLFRHPNDPARTIRLELVLFNFV